MSMYPVLRARRAGWAATALIAVALLVPVALQRAGAEPPPPTVPPTGPSTSTAHPRLLFDKDTIGALRARVTSDVPKAAYQRLLSRVDAYLTPGPNYVNPLLVIEDPYGWIYNDGQTKVHGTSH